MQKAHYLKGCTITFYNIHVYHILTLISKPEAKHALKSTFFENSLPVVCGGVPEGWHVHQRQRPVQDQVCRRHVHGDAERAQPE